MGHLSTVIFIWIKFSVIIDIIETVIPTATVSSRLPVRERALHCCRFLAVIELTNSFTAVSVLCRSVQSILTSLLLMLLMGPHRELLGKLLGSSQKRAHWASELLVEAPQQLIGERSSGTPKEQLRDFGSS